MPCRLRLNFREENLLLHNLLLLKVEHLLYHKGWQPTLLDWQSNLKVARFMEYHQVLTLVLHLVLHLVQHLVLHLVQLLGKIN